MNKEKSIEMNREEAIKQLKDLIEDRKAFCAGDYDPIFDKDIEALEYAIKELEKTALEVPVQEQLLKINNNIKFTQVSVMVCSLFTIIGFDLFFYRFNKSIQGIINILNNDLSITRDILSILKSIMNVFGNF